MLFDVYSPLHPGWKSAIDAIGLKNGDVYFLPEWYLTWENYEQSEARCIVASEDGYLFAYPFLLKPIAGFDSPKQYYDIQSAYGYGGVITNHQNIPRNIVNKFNAKVTEWLVENNVIAEFIREHPLLNHCRRDADYFPVRTNIFVETAKDYKILDSKTRQKISKIRRNNELSIVIDEQLDSMDVFEDLYNQNAARIGMSGYYFFPDEYYKLIQDHLKDYGQIINIVYKGIVINSLLYFYYGNKATLHLAGANYNYHNLFGSDYIYYSCIMHAADNGIELINLGGGMSLNEDDSLFRFKKKFSNNFKDVYIGKKIIDVKAYTSIVEQWEKSYPQLKEKYKNFFLKYRHTE